MMHQVPQAGLTVLAVADPVERMDRPHYAPRARQVLLEQPATEGDSTTTGGGVLDVDKL